MMLATEDTMANSRHFDILVAGAGISGISAAHYLQTRLPHKRYAILEGRDAIGGTWDLFRYPGIRSDSDMYTLGYSFRPWQGPHAIASGEDIRTYLVETAEAEGITDNMHFGKRIEKASWSSEEERWTITVRDTESNELEDWSCDFFWGCTGYYRYDRGHRPDFPNEGAYQGLFVHPQLWPEDLDYDDKKVVVIGSGATAVTLVPSMAERAEKVTMLQRSPTYVISIPKHDTLGSRLAELVDAEKLSRLVRWKNVFLSVGIYQACRRFPEATRRFIMKQAKQAMPGQQDTEKNFNPSYAPWDQRMCIIPDGDLFEAIEAGKAAVVTDEIESFDATGIQLVSGDYLEADIVVTATGLELQFMGGATLEVDGEAIRPNDTMLYKGAMLSGVPNAALTIGYSNASWTLRAEISSRFVCDLIERMDRRGYRTVVPQAPRGGDRVPPLDLSAGYVKRGKDKLPSQGRQRPWTVPQNYLVDRFFLRHSKIEDGVLHFTR